MRTALSVFAVSQLLSWLIDDSATERPVVRIIDNA